MRTTATLAVSALLALLLMACKPSAPDQATPATSAATAPAARVAPEPAPASPTVPLKGISAGAGINANTPRSADKPPVLEFAVPRTVGVGKGDDVSFVIQGASIEPRNPESVRVVLLVRMNNRSAYPANLWDASFRLLTHNSVIAANGGLNVVVDGRSDSALERVQFVVPLTSTPRALKIEHGGETVELPLRFL
ncbi:MAG: hypothetical protein ACREBN_02195 [Burkholderiaceae bacterium]